MKVKVGTDKTLVGEQKGVMDGDVEVGYISEMVTEPDKLSSFGFGSEVIERANALKLANEDDKAEYPVVRVEEGWSNSGRLYDRNFMESVVRQTNELEPVAHLGHIPDDQAATAFPEPQTTWIGAITKTEPSTQKARLGEMVTVAYFAGYNLPKCELRAKNLIKNKAVRGISWWGMGDLVPVPGKGVAVKNFTLKSLDWARKLSEGMPTSRIVAMAREMEETNRMDKELSQVTPDEFKEQNPNGYKLLVSEATAEKDATIGEMEAKIEEGKKTKSLLDQVMAVIGVEDPEALLTSITAMKEKVGAKASAMVKDALDKLMEEKVPNEEKRQLVMRLLPVGEMESKAEDAKDEEEVKSLVSEMVDSAFNTDDVVKGIVSEMTPPVVRRREELLSHTGNLENNSYVGEMSRVTV